MSCGPPVPAVSGVYSNGVTDGGMEGWRDGRMRMLCGERRVLSELGKRGHMVAQDIAFGGARVGGKLG